MIDLFIELMTSIFTGSGEELGRYLMVYSLVKINMSEKKKEKKKRKKQ